MMMFAVGCEQNEPTPPARPTTTADNPDNPHTTPDAENNTPGNIEMEPPSDAERPDDSTVARFLSLRAPKPATWTWHPPRSGMREANWTVPGRDGQDAAELIVFYFGPDQGGAVEENIDRWRRQFRAPDGESGSVEPDIQELTVNGMPVTIAVFEGEWMPMGAMGFQKNQKAIFAIVESPDGKVFIRFGGPTETVEANEDDVLHMIRNLEIVDDASDEDASG